MLGHPGFQNVVTGFYVEGAVLVHAPAPGPAGGVTLASVSDPTPDSELGRLVAGGGRDVDVDGVPDLAYVVEGGEVVWASVRAWGGVPRLWELGRSPLSPDAAALALGDASGDGWPDLLIGDPAADAVAVESPADPARSLSVLNASVAVDGYESVTLYLDASGLPGFDGTDSYSMLTGRIHTPDAFPLCGVLFDLEPDAPLCLPQGILETSLSNPTFFVETNFAPLGASGRAVTRLRVVPGNPFDGCLSFPLELYYQYGTYVAGACRDESDVASFVLRP